MQIFSNSLKGYDKFEGLCPVKVGRELNIPSNEIINMTHLNGNLIAFTKDHKMHKKEVPDISKFKR